MNTEADIKRQVREFYNQVGWQTIGEGLYQNARYEDLRPVSRRYIQLCHLRVGRHLQPTGNLFLDAGSGPIQYPEYLAYSAGYRRRVCVDLSIVALQDARQRIGEHGVFVVADIAHLPFKPDAFEGAISLHTIHHLPLEEHLQAYLGLYHVLTPGATAVVVNGWQSAAFDRFFDPLIRWWNRLLASRHQTSMNPAESQNGRSSMAGQQKGTFVNKHNADWIKAEVGTRMPLEIRVWRSVNVRFLRAFIRDRWGGRTLLRLVYWLEERFPHFLGENGAYPLIVIRKPRPAPDVQV